MSRNLSPRRVLLGIALALGALVATAAPASAHVEAEGQSAANGTTTVEFSFDHGCGESPTIGLRIQLPAGTTDVEAEDTAGWTSKVTDTELDWNGGPAANGTKTTFGATMKLTAKTGDTVFFPTIQTCQTGENTWIDKDPDAEGEHAAPRIVVGATTTAPTDHDADSTTTPGTTAKTSTTTAKTGTSVVGALPATGPGSSAPGTTVAPASTSTSSNTGLIAAIIAAIVVVAIIVGFVIARGRKTPEP